MTRWRERATLVLTATLLGAGTAGAACSSDDELAPGSDAGSDVFVEAQDDPTTELGPSTDGGDAEGPIDLEDFHVPGTQIGDVPWAALLRPSDCTSCHGATTTPAAPGPTWSASLMSVAGKDPLFYAQLATANQDVPGVGYYCLRCHVPASIVTGNAAIPSGKVLSNYDRDGVSCHFCHMMVDPTLPDAAPSQDAPILAALADRPSHFGNAQFVLDPGGLRRGPYVDAAALHPYTSSPFFRRSELCGTCHDVGNPAVPATDAGFAYDPPKQRAANPDPVAQFPLERTFSEWRASAFADGGVDMGGRFGGADGGVVSTCQDCHMPVETSQGCIFGPSRTDLRRHDFAGASAWVLDIVSLREGANVDQPALARGHTNAVAMLQRAATLTVSKNGAQVVVRVTNESGHKLPTGHIEGRRVFLEVKFTDGANAVLTHHGRWNPATGDLEGAPTTVFEMEIGLSPTAAKLTGLPAGPTTHMSLADVVVSDNRIPPRGFSNVAFGAVGAGAVGATYADGQHWADVPFAIPNGATKVEVRLLYQTVTREYVEALAKGNKTDGWGTELQSLWLATGRAPPIEMASTQLSLP